MANGDNQVDRWVKEKIDLLEPEKGWDPDPAAAFVRFRARERRARFGRRAFWLMLSAAAAGVALLVVQAPRACATPRGCAVHWWNVVFPGGAAALPQVAEDSAGYKQMGSPHAPVTCEIYSDYECPACARFYLDTMPLFIEDFVKTGKVRLVHRDYPLALHPYSRLAARYADAAGEAGFYQEAVNRIFRTQDAWKQTGDIAAQLAGVLPDPILRQVEDRVRQDSGADGSIAADMALGSQDHVQGTPTLVIVWKGHRQVIWPVPEYSRLRAYLNELH